MARAKSLVELERERGRLQERIAAQRDALGLHLVPVQNLLQTGDRIADVLNTVRGFIGRHPLALGSLAAVALLRKPRSILRWGRRGLLLWRSWRAIRSLTTTVRRQLDLAAGVPPARAYRPPVSPRR